MMAAGREAQAACLLAYSQPPFYFFWVLATPESLLCKLHLFRIPAPLKPALEFLQVVLWRTTHCHSPSTTCTPNRG